MLSFDKSLYRSKESQICFDFTKFCTDLESTQGAPRWPKMSFILGKFNDLFTSKLHLSLPATTRGPLCASHCIQESASLVKVSPICFKIAVWKYTSISQIFVPIWRVHLGLLCDAKWASYWEYWMTYSLANFIFLSQLLSAMLYAYHTAQAAASLVKVSTLCLKI